MVGFGIGLGSSGDYFSQYSGILDEWALCQSRCLKASQRELEILEIVEWLSHQLRGCGRDVTDFFGSAGHGSLECLRVKGCSSGGRRYCLALWSQYDRLPWHLFLKLARAPMKYLIEVYLFHKYSAWAETWQLYHKLCLLGWWLPGPFVILFHLPPLCYYWWSTHYCLRSSRGNSLFASPWKVSSLFAGNLWRPDWLGERILAWCLASCFWRGLVAYRCGLKDQHRCYQWTSDDHLSSYCFSWSSLREFVTIRAIVST